MQTRWILLLGVLLGSFFLLTGAKSNEIKGKVTYLEGEAFLVKSSNKTKKLKIQSKIKTGSRIRTEKSSAIEITFSNGHVIRISENAEVLLSNLDGQASVELQKGKLWSNIQKLAKGNTYEVKSKTATASVRGTIFNVMAQDSNTRVALFEGQVGVAPRKELKQESNGWGPPTEIAGPQEVTEEQWILLDPGQMIDMNWDGTYRQQAIPETKDTWVEFNQKRDQLVERGDVH